MFQHETFIAHPVTLTKGFFCRCRSCGNWWVEPAGTQRRPKQKIRRGLHVYIWTVLSKVMPFASAVPLRMSRVLRNGGECDWIQAIFHGRRKPALNARLS